MKHAIGLLMAALVAGYSLQCEADCLDDAAAYQGINVQLVRVIAQQESTMRADAVHVNTDGSEDIGLMQVNSRELPRLARYGITRQHLFDRCINAYVGTWILASKIRRFGRTWKAVGAYNASSPEKQLAYAIAIRRRLQRAGN
ncbi:lytic transglycosylase domain-containing protein [Paraburkholderia sediminicola]|uniref:lytic transglycosylase domain-containing protein n=1 Tax=Paraburkholderia sediminicola TaxID=458836 RepID=UPI0038B712E5